MSGLKVEIEIGPELEKALGSAAKQASDLSKPMGEIAGVMYDETRARFDREQDPFGAPWKKSRRAAKMGGKTLFDSGQLLRSIVADFGADFAQIGVQVNAEFLDTGASVKSYAAIHQFGGTIKRSKKKTGHFGADIVAEIVMPARPYLGFGAEERDETVKILAAHIENIFTKG